MIDAAFFREQLTGEQRTKAWAQGAPHLWPQLCSSANMPKNELGQELYKEELTCKVLVLELAQRYSHTKLAFGNGEQTTGNHV